MGIEARLPQATGAQLLNALQKVGIRVTRQRGSHVQVRRGEPDGPANTVPIPVYAGRTRRTASRSR